MSSEIFRDRTEGTAAKRQELLRRRRDELVTMPHAVRRVIVTRSARIAASMAITVGGVAMIATAWSPHLAGRIASVMPGIQPAPLSTLLSGTWLLGLVAWAISRARVEHRFAVAMSKYVLPSNDLDHDVERLDHERPDDMARTMGQDLEVRSAAWPIFAASVVLPATALWVARIVRTHSWPVMSEFELGLAAHAGTLALIGIGGAVGAIAMTRKMMRQPAIALVTLPFGVLATGFAFFALAKGTAYAWPLCAVAVIVTGIGVVARILKKERALLEVDDPAAGSEIFTIRGALRELRQGLVAIHRGYRGLAPRSRLMIMAGGLGLVAGGVYLKVRASEPERNIKVDWQTATQIQLSKPDTLLVAPKVSVQYIHDHRQKVERIGNQFRVEAVLDEHGEATIPMIGFSTVPQNWRAELDVTLTSLDAVGILDHGDLRYLSSANPRTTITTDACAGSEPLALHVQQAHAANQTVQFWVVPTLTVASCR